MEEGSTIHDWIECFDDEGNRFYYNTTTEETAWEIPSKTPTGKWIALVDESTNATYYWNEITQETCWDAPKGWNSEDFEGYFEPDLHDDNDNDHDDNDDDFALDVLQQLKAFSIQEKAKPCMEAKDGEVKAVEESLPQNLIDSYRELPISAETETEIEVPEPMIDSIDQNSPTTSIEDNHRSQKKYSDPGIRAQICSPNAQEVDITFSNEKKSSKESVVDERSSVLELLNGSNQNITTLRNEIASNKAESCSSNDCSSTSPRCDRIELAENTVKLSENYVESFDEHDPAANAENPKLEKTILSIQFDLNQDNKCMETDVDHSTNFRTKAPSTKHYESLDRVVDNVPVPPLVSNTLHDTSSNETEDYASRLPEGVNNSPLSIDVRNESLESNLNQVLSKNSLMSVTDKCEAFEIDDGKGFQVDTQTDGTIKAQSEFIQEDINVERCNDTSEMHTNERVKEGFTSVELIGQDEIVYQEIEEDKIGQEEIGQDEIVNEEIEQDKIGQEEIGKEEIWQEEIVQDEIVDQEIEQNEIVNEGIKQDEMVDEEIGQDEIVNEEIEQDEIVNEEIEQDEIVDQEIKQGEIVDQALEQDEIVEDVGLCKANTSELVELDYVEKISDEYPCDKKEKVCENYTVLHGEGVSKSCDEQTLSSTETESAAKGNHDVQQPECKTDLMPLVFLGESEMQEEQWGMADSQIELSNRETMSVGDSDSDLSGSPKRGKNKKSKFASRKKRSKVVTSAEDFMVGDAATSIDHSSIESKKEEVVPCKAEKTGFLRGLKKKMSFVKSKTITPRLSKSKLPHVSPYETIDKPLEGIQRTEQKAHCSPLIEEVQDQILENSLQISIEPESTEVEVPILKHIPQSHFVPETVEVMEETNSTIKTFTKNSQEDPPCTDNKTKEEIQVADNSECNNAQQQNSDDDEVFRGEISAQPLPRIVKQPNRLHDSNRLQNRLRKTIRQSQSDEETAFPPLNHLTSNNTVENPSPKKRRRKGKTKKKRADMELEQRKREMADLKVKATRARKDWIKRKEKLRREEEKKIRLQEKELRVFITKQNVLDLQCGIHQTIQRTKEREHKRAMELKRQSEKHHLIAKQLLLEKHTKQTQNSMDCISAEENILQRGRKAKKRNDQLDRRAVKAWEKRKRKELGPLNA